jgi:hypothetical protein
MPTLNHTSRALMTTLSGCRMTQWVYIDPIILRPLPTNPTIKVAIKYRKRDCLEEPPHRRLSDMTMLKEGDTIYIPLLKLHGFVLNALQNVTVPVVIISGQWVRLKQIPMPDAAIATLLDNPMVIAWFCQNLDIHASNYTNHPKVHPWPYGLEDPPFRHEYAKREIYRHVLDRAGSKNSVLHLTYFSLKTNPSGRKSIPNGIMDSNLTEFYDNMAKAHFIFSPNGDRPESYRHYEAIGLGTMPITQLDPHIHRHLASSVINNTNWNTHYWNSTVAVQNHFHVNRALAFEYYWIKYAERQVGKPLNWAIGM